MPIWARATLGIDCGACGAKSALARVAADTTCLHCGTEHTLDTDELEKALERIHDAAAEGHRCESTAGSLVLTGEADRPVCAKCGEWVELDVQAERVLARCLGCKAVTSHARPNAWRSAYESVAAVVFDDNRDDLVEAKVTEQDGRASLGCGSCGGAIAVSADRSFATCTYCGASSHVPLSAQPKARNGPRSRPMWIQFEGRTPAATKDAKHRQEMRDSLASAERDEMIAVFVIGGSILFSVVAGVGYLIYWLVTR